MAACAGLLARGVASGSGGLTQVAAIGVAAAVAKAAGQTFAGRTEATMGAHVGEAQRDLALVRMGRDATLRASGREAVRAGRAAREVELSVRTGVFGAVRAGVALVPLAGILVWTAPVAAGVAIGVMGAFGVVLSLARRKKDAAERSALDDETARDHAADELLRHVDAFRVYGTLPLARRLLGEASRRATLAAARAAGARSAASGGNEIAAAAALLVVVALVEQGRLGVDPGALVLFVSVFFLAYRPVRDLADARAARAMGEAALATPPPAAPDQGTRRARVPGELRLESFGAAHATARLTAAIAPGEVVALTGPNGVGKTSLLRALAGLETSVGEASFGGDGLAAAPFERPFAFVPADAPLLHGTLDDNLAVSGDATAARAALDRLAAPGFAASLDGALVGDAARTLSAGERAWVSLARALGSGLPVLLVDEPTAHLDADAERRFVEALASLRGERTVLFVTHRASTAALADRTLPL